MELPFLQLKVSSKIFSPGNNLKHILENQASEGWKTCKSESQFIPENPQMGTQQAYFH